VYRFVCIWDNKQRDKAGVMEGFDHAYEDDSTDRKVSGKNSVKFSGGNCWLTRYMCRTRNFGILFKSLGANIWTVAKG
jgi:hypothetical protein